MRRQELTEAAATVLKALSSSSIKATLSQHLRNIRQADDAKLPSPEYLLSSMRTYWSFANLYTPNERKVADSLKLSQLEDSKFWSDLLGGKSDTKSDTAQKAQDLLTTISAAESYLPTVLNLVDDMTSTKSRPENTLSLLLSEEGQTASKPLRVVRAIESINLLYGVYAELHDKDVAELGLSACDSGRDKVFIFSGDAEVMASLKKCLLELWDRVVFFRDRQSDTYAEFLTESLPVMAKISDLQVQGELTVSQVDILKENLTEGVERFIFTGAMIPEIVTVLSFQPQELLMPNADMFAVPPIVTDKY